MIAPRVKCDAPGCDWTQEVEKDQMVEWHKKPCPKCGQGEIIADEELIALEMVLGLERASQRIRPNGDGLAHVLFDSLGFRK